MVRSPIVIGSGPAGFAATRKLVELGHRPIVIDAGITLDSERGRVVARMASTSPHSWAPADIRALESKDSPEKPFLARTTFGSEHVYSPLDSCNQFRTSPGQPPVPSYAFGGLSNIWSAAMLPAHDDDMSDWPITRRGLAAHYRDVLSWIPMAGERDDLEQKFPIYRSEVDRLAIPTSANELLLRLRRRSDSLAARGFHVGRSRLAVSGSWGEESGCRYCGRCHSGCVYGAIWNSQLDLKDLIARDVVGYRSGLLARSVEETEGGVRIRCDRVGGGHETICGSRVYVAAGAINSTRIVLESLRLWDHPVKLRTSQGFALPLLPLWHTTPWPTTMDLASLFVEFKTYDSEHWVHTQIGPVHDEAMRELDKRGGRFVAPRLVRSQIKQRVLIAGFNMHSDHAGHHVLRLVRQSGGPNVLEMTTVPNPTFTRRARRAAWQFGRELSRSMVLAVPPLGSLATDQPLSWHVGGSLPMRRHRKDVMDTDVLGRPQQWRRTHVVDSSVFPTVPGTTVVLLAMANAARIVDGSARYDDSTEPG